MNQTIEAPAPAHPTWGGKTEAWKFLPETFLKNFLTRWTAEYGVRDLAQIMQLGAMLNDFATEMEAQMKSLMNPVSGLHLEKPSIHEITEGDAVMKLLDDIRVLWNEQGAPGTFVGSTTPMSDEEHKTLHNRMIDNTRTGHDIDMPEKTPMHGVYIAGTSSAICITGNTPNAHRRATMISMLLAALPGLFVMIKMAEANLKGADLDAEAQAIIAAATVAPSDE